MKHHLESFTMTFVMVAPIAIFTAVQVTDLILPRDSWHRRVAKRVAVAGGISLGLTAGGLMSLPGDEGIVYELVYVGGTGLVLTGLCAVWYFILVVLGKLHTRTQPPPANR